MTNADINAFHDEVKCLNSESKFKAEIKINRRLCELDKKGITVRNPFLNWWILNKP